MKCIPLFMIATTLFWFISSCNKTSSDETLPELKIIHVSGVKFNNPVSNVRQTYDEMACITSDSMAGTRCFSSTGKTCSSEHDCTGIPKQLQSGNYTKEELLNSVKLVEKTYGIKYEF